MRTFLRFAAISYIAYLAITLLVITPALNILPHKYVEDNYGRQLQTKWVLLNPFKISLDVREASLSEPDGESFASLEKASVNLSVESLWRRGWVLDTVKLKEFSANLIRKTESEFNFSDLLASDSEAVEPENDEGGIPGVTIHDLDLHAHTILLADQTRDVPYSSSWNELHISVDDISTVIEEGRPYDVRIHGEGGGKLHWQGTISIPKGSSEGHLSLSNLSLARLWRLAEPWVQFEIADGRLAVEGDYYLNWREDLVYQVEGGELGLTVIDIQPKLPDQLADTAVQLAGLNVGGISVDSTAQQASLESVVIDGLTLSGWSEGAKVSLQNLFEVSLADEPGEAEPAEETPASEGWRARVGKVQLSNSGVHWRSEFTDPPLLDVTPIEATVENLNWPLSGESPLSLSLSINNLASIAIDGGLALAGGNGNINYALEGLPLTWFNPNLPEALNGSFTDGQIHIQGQVALADFAPATVNLDGAVKNFAASQEDDEITLTSWETVRLDGLMVDLSQNKLVLEKLAIDDYVGRLHIHKDGSINSSNIWKEEMGDEAREITEGAAEESTEESTEELAEEKPWSISVPAILITDSQIDFMDESLPLPFRTVVGDLNGEIGGISSDPGAMANVVIKGSVDSHAPVSLEGDLNPLSSPPAMDLKLDFDGVDLAPMTPYSGTYAGYAIEQGLINLHLQYFLQDNHLKGKNDIRIDQLKLGEKVDSDKAVDLPLELALAILTDSNGVIDLSVPVEGDVDDPKFALGSVIGKAFINIITKIVTAPFSILASLVDSEEDLQRLAFASGSAELDEASKTKLDQIAAAMAQRPNLSLVVTGRLNVPADRTRLQKNALRDQLLAAGLSEQEINTKGPAWEQAIGKRYGTLPASKEQETSATAGEQHLRVVESIAVTDAQLLELAEQRAVAAKQYLVMEAGLDGSRAVVGQTRLEDEAANIFSGVELSVDS